MKYAGLFAGLTTVDIQYFVKQFPGANEKVKANAPEVLVGGPATNAAVAFACLNNGAFLASATGNNSFSQFIANDFRSNKIQHFNLTGLQENNPVLASVITSSVNGDRTIFTHHPEKIVPEVSASVLLSQVNPQIVLLDGFYPEFSVELARKLRQERVPVVLDCGSWKPQYKQLIPLADVAICSEDFFPPGCKSLNSVVDFLHNNGICKSAISRGEKRLFFYDSGKRGEVEVEQTQVADTLGAGDFLHGAFCFYYLNLNFQFEEALHQAVKFATFTCGFKGTRNWIKYFEVI